MPLRADYIQLRVQHHSSGSTNEVIAESTSVNVSFSAEFLETTNQTSALNQSGIGGKVAGTVSGDYLLAAAGTQFKELFAHMNNGDTIEVVLYKSAVAWITTEGVITSLDVTGGLSDALATGSYSINITGAVAVA